VGDVVLGVIVGNELQGVGDRLDEVFLADRGHDGWKLAGGQEKCGKEYREFAYRPRKAVRTAVNS
jgi:hypothetical protein